MKTGYETIGAHARWTCIVQREIMQMLERAGLPCETWEEAGALIHWLLGELRDD